MYYTSIRTFWGNQTIRVKDNTTFLGAAQNEGNLIWSFDETAYGLHTFAIYVYNGGDTWDIIYTSVTIVEPAAETNYYLTIETSVDAAGGLFYVMIETYFDNCTIRVMDNTSFLGDNTTEGSSIWSFDETAYGLHNFTIFIYQGYDLWDTITTSVTIIAPDLTALGLTVYEKHFDADAGLLYVNYETTWGNTTIQLMDNGTLLGPPVAGEENSIWLFTASIGLHNISITISHDGVAWFTDIFSFTINIPYQVWKDVSFTFRSDYDSGYIDADYYLKIFLDGVIIGSSALTYKDNFSLTIYDEHDQLLYENATYLYQYSSTIYLPLRSYTITNNDYIPIAVSILATGSDAGGGLFLLVPSAGSVSVYLKDGSYTILDIPTIDEVAGGNDIYTATSVVMEVSATQTAIGLFLGQKEDPQFLLNFSWTKLSEANQRILEQVTFGFIILVILLGVIIFLVVRNRREREKREKELAADVKLTYIYDREKTKEENVARKKEIEQINERRRKEAAAQRLKDPDMEVKRRGRRN